MKIFPLLVVISSAAHLALSERQVVSINDRTFSIYWPTPNNATHAGDGSCTILLGLHGLGDNADSFCAWTAFKEYAERDGVVLVCPQGLPGWLGEAAWNAGSCCTFSGVDDVSFIDSVVSSVRGYLQQRNQQCVSQSILLAGFSNGAMMAEAYACERPTDVKGVVSVAGVVALLPIGGGLDSCDRDFAARAGRSVAVLGVHGTKDWRVPMNGDPIVGFPPVREDLQRWAQRGKCLTTGPSDPSQFRRGRFSNEIICATELGESSVELVVREDGTHAWFEETEFDTSEYAWSFMMRAANVTEQPGVRGRPLLDGQLRSQRVRASEKASEGMRRFREAHVQPEPFLFV
ncbi:unnamed protein product [Vitrella brassicaformis CCMP3155]|uniref:Phospholipase/carboxylesterase/thioesterase domain-containing protein n=1 Tax=Vitrella brassicaformis (strain CCMP3155) TaxID=1169540 RepID=A0A0G4EX82_VITBC|nr:unnamed protein product [Vitrella brassicaformis CCMP3155]|eukprot:CEM03174.1 unnamed protein product [Vitrella brassicaformis CCMP3155]